MLSVIIHQWSPDMESPYSKAFDHLARPDSIGKQGAHNVQQVGGVLFCLL